MGTQVYRDAKFEINGVDLSDHVQELSITHGAEMLDETAMGVDTRIKKGGLKTWSMDVTFKQNFALAKVDKTLFPLVGTTVCVETRPINTCTTGTAPQYIGIGVVENYPPMGGAVGSLLQTKVTIQSAGSLSRVSCSTA